MKAKFVSLTGPVAFGLRALLMGAMGCLILTRPRLLEGSLALVLVVALGLNGVTTLATGIKSGSSWVSGALSLLLAAAVALWPGILIYGASLFYGLWMLLNAMIQLSYAYQLVVTRSRGAWLYLPIGMVSLLLGVEVIFHPVAGAGAAGWLSGVYFLLLGMWQLVDMVAALLGKNVESSRVLSRIRIKPPVILTAMLPSRTLTKIRKRAAGMTADFVTDKPNGVKKAYTGRLQVVFHLGETVAIGFGHTDIHFHGSVYSYGCYDAQSNRFFGVISDGVFMTAPSEPYLAYCRVYEGKSLVGYEIGLTKAAEKRVADALESTLRPCRPWSPPEDAMAAEGTPAHCRQMIGSRYFKVSSGPFRYYNVFKTNCAAMAEILAGESGLHLLPPAGAVTPGAYFSFLESELADPASDVLRRVVYHPLKRI